MKHDVIEWAAGRRPTKRPSKETLNHPGLIALASGLDPFAQTAAAFLHAYAALGIDLINIVPEAPAPIPLEPGAVRFRDDGVSEAYLGVFNTTARVRFPFQTLDEFWDFDFRRLEYGDLKLPGAQYTMPCRRDAIERKLALAAPAGLYYYQLYTTLFMWGVEGLGWEIFLLAVGSEPARFNRHFLEPVFETSKRIMTLLSTLDTPLVFVHDDIAASTGPVCHPDWYREYIFPRYEELWRIPHEHGKKLVFVADGRLDWALEALRATGVDGVMFEAPATALDAVIDVFGDRLFIGGIGTETLRRGDQDAIRRHVEDVTARTDGCDGFALCSAGGLNGDLPLPHLEAYFDARVDAGFTAPGWRHENR